MSQAYGVRPSEILRIEDEWAAWQLDETCLIVGREIEKASSEGKAFPVTIRKGARKKEQSYAPMKMPGIQKMKIPENGIW